MIKEEKQSGFVAGTLVHTDKGLVPIEQIIVGDMVLSKPDSDPNAPNAYKRVISTFKSSEKKKITYVDYRLIDNESMDSDIECGVRRLFCTEDHPFWMNQWDIVDGTPIAIKTIGWDLAKNIDDGCTSFVTCDGRFAIAEYTGGTALRLRRSTLDSQVAFAERYRADDIYIYDFRGGEPLFVLDGYPMSPTESSIPINEWINTYEGNIYQDISGECYQDYVYNIEVEDYHTYFVGNAGIWVHNATANIS